jgi:uncharacterized protein (UPF0332 family)
VTPEAYTEKASRALASAKLLLADGDFEGACNRAYYAMFDAAHALLLQSGATEVTNSHTEIAQNAA